MAAGAGPTARMARILRPATLALLLVLLTAGAQGQDPDQPDTSLTATPPTVPGLAADPPSSSTATTATNPAEPTTAQPPSPNTPTTEAPSSSPTINPATTLPPTAKTPPTDPTPAPATVTAAGSSAAPSTSSAATTAGSTRAPTTVAPATPPPAPVTDQVANLPLDISTQPCGRMSCALGQMLADGVRTGVNRRTGTTKWTDAVRAVIIPASAFNLDRDSALKAGVLLQAELLKVLANKDEVVCKGELTVAALNDTLNRMLAAGDFPQVSGLEVTLDYQEGQALVSGLWAETALLDMLLLDPADTTTRVWVALPCTYARDTMKIEGMQNTAVQLQDGLNELLPKDTTDVLVPPVVQPRVRPHVAFPHQWDLCEDWTGMTVAYTLLVLGALVMVSYQGYQFWRFRSTLSYVR